jgi:hypothetical protein
MSKMAIEYPTRKNMDFKINLLSNGTSPMLISHKQVNRKI